MPTLFKDHCELDDDEVFSRLRNKLPQEFGKVLYVVAFNAIGREMLFTRKGIAVEEFKEGDRVWKVANQALALLQDAKYDYSHVRMGRCLSEHGLSVTFETDLCDPIGGKCKPGLFVMPRDMIYE